MLLTWLLTGLLTGLLAGPSGQLFREAHRSIPRKRCDAGNAFDEAYGRLRISSGDMYIGIILVSR